MVESEERKRWCARTLKLVEKLRPIAVGGAASCASCSVVLTPDEAAAIIIALATTYVVAEGAAMMSGEGEALFDATLEQWAVPPASVS